MIWGLALSAWNMLKALPAQVRTWLAVGAAACVALWYAYARGQSEARERAREQEMQRDLEVRRGADEIRQDVARSSDADVARRLREFTQPR